MKRRSTRAFSLVELVIVIIVIGILAAMVVVRYSFLSDEAKANNIRSQLATLQVALDSYKVKYGVYPAVSNLTDNPADGTTKGWDVLIDNGFISAAPENPAAPSGDEHVAAAAAAAGVAWVYDAATGKITGGYYDEAANAVTPGVP